MKYDIIIAGVGGQGTVLASRVLATAALKAGYFVRTAETIGMAQRGGSVVSFVRIGSEKAGSIVPHGAGDLLLGFEPAEAARCLPRLGSSGICIVNTRPIEPVPVALGKETYNMEGIIASIRHKCPRSLFVDALRLAAEAGSPKALNSVMLGLACGSDGFPLPAEAVREALRELLPPRLAQVNLRAFEGDR